MFKNTASKFMVFAWDTTTGVAKTGDAANITAYVSKDYGTVTVLADTSATEMDATNGKGYYLFDAAQGETNGDCLMVSAKSSTANIAVIGAPAVIYTRPATGWLAPTVAARTLDVSATGEAGVDWANVGSPTTSNSLTGTTIATTQKVDVDTIKTNPVVNGGTVTFPTTATLASTTNITAATGVDITKILGTAISTPATAGILDVNIKNMNNVAATSITTINANQGTTQPVNYTGTGASALVKSDMVDIAGAAVSTSTAQIGVNSVNIGGTAQTGRDIGASVLLSSGTGTGQLDFTSGVVKANLAQILGTALTETAGLIAAGFKQFFNIASPTSTMNVITTVTTATTATNLTNAPTNGDLTATMKTSVENTVWNATMASHLTGGTTGASLNGAGSAGDPWTTPIPGAYSSGTAGYILGTNLDAVVSTAPPTATQNADALLNRNMSAVSDTNARSPLNALRAIRNKVSIAAGTVTVTKEDDTTSAWTGAVTTDAAANPITAIDPT